MNDQIGMFQMLYNDFKFTKEVREIETFAGYGSQHMSLKRLNDEGRLKSKSWKTVEWEYHAVESYYEVHCSDDKTDYAKDMTYDDLLTFFLDSGISANGKEPMSTTQIKRKSEEWMRELYNKIKATHNLIDITKVHSKDLEIVEKDKYQYLLTYSFPCQDLSKAGKQKGMAKGDGTRSGMLWEIERIIGECYRDKCLPDVLMMENVPDVIGSKNMKDFMKWYASLEAVGYQSYYKTLNAKDFGVPQNRERCFMVSILGDYNYSFPKKITLDLKLKDILEKDVDEKYYISQDKINYMKNTNFVSSSFDRVVQQENDICSTLCARDYKDPKCVQLGNLQGGKWDKVLEQHKRIYDIDGLSPTITTRQNADEQPKFLAPIEGGVSVVIPEATAKGYALANDGDYINLSYMESNTRRGRVGKVVSQTLLCNDNNGVVINSANGIYTNSSSKFDRGPLENLSRTLKSENHDTGVVENNLRIRKLTPRECGRLMGVSDEDITKMARVNSNSQLYKQFGNSIVVDVLYYIFKQMCKEVKDELRRR